MRILIDGSSLVKSRTGIGNYTYSLLENLLEIDPQNEYYVIAREWPEELGVKFANHLDLVSDGSILRYLPYDALGLTSRFDLYHEPNYIPRIFGGKTIITVHDMSHRIFPQYHPKRRVAMLRLLEGRIKQAERIITDSNSSKQQISVLMRIPEERIIVTYLGAGEQFRPMDITSERKAQLQKTYNLPESFLLYVGTIEPRKNLEKLIEAFNIYKKEEPDSEVRLVLVGGKGWLYDAILRKVRNLNLKADVIFTGYVPDEDLPYLYNLALAFVYPSLYEGFGLPPLEAMSCGIPVISSNTSSIPEVVGNAGLLVDPLRTEDLASAMHQVLKSIVLRNELSQKGLERAKLFSWRRCAEETLQVYNAVYS